MPLCTPTLHGRLAAGPRAPPEALRHVLALQLLRFPAVCQLLLPGLVCAGLWDTGLGFRRLPSSPRSEAPDCLCGLQPGSFSGFLTPRPISLPKCLPCACRAPTSDLLPAAFPRRLLHSRSCVRSASRGFTWLSPSGSASQLAPEYTVQLLAKEGKTSHRLPKCTYSHSVMAFQLSGSFLSQEWQSGVGS